MKPSVASKVGSILISTTLVIAFAIVQAPLRNPSAKEAGVVVRKPIQDVNAKKKLNLIVGKSIIVDSKAEILRATVADPQLAEAFALDSHELLVNAKVVGETTLTLWQQDGKQRAFELTVAANLDRGHVETSQDSRMDGVRTIVASYSNAFRGKVNRLRTSSPGEAQ